MTDPKQVARETIGEYNGYHLANRADCSTPSKNEDDSAGSDFLTRVRDDVLEAIDDDDEHILTEEPNYSGRVSEIADGAVPIYTAQKWRTFVDLGAYNEDPTDLGADGSDMDAAAGVCLYIIAERLAYALLQEIRDELELLDEDENE